MFKEIIIKFNKISQTQSSRTILVSRFFLIQKKRNFSISRYIKWAFEQNLQKCRIKNTKTLLKITLLFQ